MEKNGSTHLDHQSSKFEATGYPQVEIDRLTGAQQQLSYEDLDHEDRLERILNNPNIDEWCTRESLDTLAYFRPISQQWALIKARYKKLGGFPPDLERAVDAQLQIERASASAPPAPPRFQTISARELYAKALPPQQWIIPDILPVGETLFIGRGKDGKSLLVWNLCLAVATGGKALSAYDVEEGDVLYLALEDGERRAQQRLT